MKNSQRLTGAASTSAYVACWRRPKTDPGVLLLLPNYWAGEKQVIAMEMLGSR
jgi:hypothetical protein